MRSSSLATLLLVLIVSSAAQAKGEVYKWVDKDGVVHYGSEPPNDKAKPAELPPLQTYKPSAMKNAPLSTLDASSTASKPGAAGTVNEVKITTPAAEEVIRDTSGVVAVAAAILPTPPAGATYNFYLDGKKANTKAWPSPSFSFTGVERGSHSVEVAVVGPNGTELKRSKPVTFHSKPPQAR